MAFDFDPFSQLDMNFDSIVDSSDLKLYELSHGNSFDTLDLNHDTIVDQYQLDLNKDLQIDAHQIDANGNGTIDKYEFEYVGTKFSYDLNHDHKIDELDMALATCLYPK